MICFIAGNKKMERSFTYWVRFYPAKKELIDFYLVPKNMGKSFFPGLINELDLYEHNPTSLQGRYIYIYIYINLF